jgi:signal transduction histidine kinase
MENSSGRILIVDDLPANLRLLEGILKVAGYEVVTASSGAEALETIATAEPDVVLLDVMMPEMDGFETCRRIKSQPDTSWLPIVMVTALQETGDRVAALEAGADDFLTKPVDDVEVIARVNSLVRVKRQRQDLERAYGNLSRAESMRDGLTAMLVHDLRTPLTAILGSLETLRFSNPDEFQSELIEICSRSSNRLLSLVNDLLDVGKMESGQMRLTRTPVAVKELIYDSLDQVMPFDGHKRMTAYGRSIEVEVVIPEELPSLQADHDLLGRVLINLLGNAAKFAPSNAQVQITAVPLPNAHYPDGEPGVLFSVRDNGPGIAKEDHHRIFDKFGQVESQQSGRKLSTGLGLTFCRLAVEAHGGKIWVDSAPGEGSTFWFSIPV